MCQWASSSPAVNWSWSIATPYWIESADFILNRIESNQQKHESFVFGHGRPFVKRFFLCYQPIVCPVCLSVTLVYCGQTVWRIKMKHGMQVGLGPGHIVLDGDPAPPPPKGHRPQFSAHICCCQMAAWIKMSLGKKLGLDLGDFVLDWDRVAPSPKVGGPKNFRPMFIVTKQLDGWSWYFVWW